MAGATGRGGGAGRGGARRWVAPGLALLALCAVALWGGGVGNVGGGMAWAQPASGAERGLAEARHAEAEGAEPQDAEAEEGACPYRGRLYPPGTRLGDLVCRDGAWVPA